MLLTDWQPAFMKCSATLNMCVRQGTYTPRLLQVKPPLRCSGPLCMAMLTLLHLWLHLQSTLFSTLDMPRGRGGGAWQQLASRCWRHKRARDVGTVTMLTLDEYGQAAQHDVSVEEDCDEQCCSSMCSDHFVQQTLTLRTPSERLSALVKSEMSDAVRLLSSNTEHSTWTAAYSFPVHDPESDAVGHVALDKFTDSKWCGSQ